MKIGLVFSQIIEKIIFIFLIVVLSLIVIHAPMVVGLGTVFPKYATEIKAWKEILILITGILLIVFIIINRKIDIFKDKVVILSLLFIAINFLTVIFLRNNIMATISGLMIDLRFITYFLELYIFLKLRPKYKKAFVMSLIIGALIVLVFALLQITVLPKDVLKYIGYGDGTIEPYLLVDKNNQFVRINSTMRGPNPLGAYATVCILMSLIYLMEKTNNKVNQFIRQKGNILALVMFVLSIVALWFSYSRSALLATIIGIILIICVKLAKKWPKLIYSSLTLVAVIIISVIAISWKTNFVQQVVLHENPDGGSVTKSDYGHVSSLVDGIKSVINRPFGYGIGSTGSASLYTKSPIIVENQFVFTAHEVGILGLVFFLILLFVIFAKLASNINNSFIFGVLISGIMMCFIGLFLPVWTDDTISIISWGMFAIALNYNKKEIKKYA
jgi:hypothetical protein